MRSLRRNPITGIFFDLDLTVGHNIYESIVMIDSQLLVAPARPEGKASGS